MKKMYKKVFARYVYERLEGLSATEFADVVMSLSGMHRASPFTLEQAYAYFVSLELALNGRMPELPAGAKARVYYKGHEHWPHTAVTMATAA